MDNTIETIEKHGYTATISYDMDGSSADPRENDNLGTIIGWHRRYNIGEQRFTTDPGDFLADLQRERAIYLPVFMYEHSGVALSTGSFGDPWDSGQVGFIYVSRADVLKEYSTKIVTKKVREQVLGVLKAEVAEYSAWMGGEVYGFEIVDAEGEFVDSCWGFIGLDNIRDEVNAILENLPHTLPLPEPQRECTDCGRALPDDADVADQWDGPDGPCYRCAACVALVEAGAA